MATSRRRRSGVSPAVRRAQAFLRRVSETLAEKNARYGDSAARPLRVFSRAPADEQLRVRIDDKLSRLTRTPGDDEGTLLDLVGYLALLAALRDASGDARGRRTMDARPGARAAR